ncbi:hypothetical protein BDF21DRAFT_430625 [Thamnidium elegans]|nr:hypothetical protein BDF21DRAFT_430625 [Thamnidium elegans]
MCYRFFKVHHKTSTVHVYIDQNRNTPCVILIIRYPFDIKCTKNQWISHCIY